ncbi:MAG: amidohydrolase family protein [Deltaproteobacteria bacterium]|nr:amidohydrolase family protein [Deltaproteobacteria bacterium]MBW2072213.1 amidohydrolase family protein [Deltaproteobacteria bacterium]
MNIVDSHIHCGVQNVNLPFETVRSLLSEAGISSACLFAPVEDVYDRYDYYFQDSEEWQQTRRRANQYVIDIATHNKGIFPYLFVWNDFAVDELEKPYCGIKWHRHPNEPCYHYDSPGCVQMIEEITKRRLPVVFEESFANTCRFVSELAAGAVIIIPHLGSLNGSYQLLDKEGIWQRPHVYADSALAQPIHLAHFIKKYGADRLLFGSDFPFSTPAMELRKIEQLGLNSADMEKVVGGNVIRLLAAIN